MSLIAYNFIDSNIFDEYIRSKFCYVHKQNNSRSVSHSSMLTKWTLMAKESERDCLLATEINYFYFCRTQFFPIPWKKYKFLRNQQIRAKSYVSDKLCVNPKNEKILNLTETSILGNLTNFY
jgi:hypothetical protein